MTSQGDRDTSKWAVGGSGTRGDALRKLLRQRPAAPEQAKRLLTGEAWRDFCRALERAGDTILRADVPGGERARAEGFRYLLGLLTSGIRQATEQGDPDYPVWIRNPDSASKWGAENADNQYLWACLRPDRTYRVTGDRRNALDFLIEVKEGYMQLGDERNFATLWAHDLVCTPDGRFEILLAAREPNPRPPNFMPLHPDARYVTVRQYLADWAKETPARFEIECLETAGTAPELMTPAQAASMLDSAGEWTEVTARIWDEWVQQLRRDYKPGQLAPPVSFVGGADDILYGNDWYKLSADEALILSVDVPRARYWAFQLCDTWFKTMDYANRQSSLNHVQTRVDPDGRLRFVIAHRDPGYANWIDTGGQQEGMIQYRYVFTETKPLPSVRIVRFEELGKAMPAGAPRVTPAERRAEIVARQAHLRRREPAS
jgi:hypothetical protein